MKFYATKNILLKPHKTVGVIMATRKHYITVAEGEMNVIHYVSQYYSSSKAQISLPGRH